MLAAAMASPARPARLAAARVVAVLAAALAGCGSEPVRELPRAAEPPRSPPLVATPAGRVVPVGAEPEGAVADPRTGTVAVALRDPPGLALVDGASGRVRRVVALPGAPRHLALAAAGGPVLVPAESADALLTVALRSGRVTARVAVGAHPHDVAAVAGGVAAVGEEGGNAVAFVRAGRLVRTVPVATQPGGLAALDARRTLAVVSVRERVLELYDARSGRRIARAPAGAGPTHVACLERTWCYVLDTRGDVVLVFRRTARLELARRVSLPGGPYGIALDPRRRLLYVTLPARNELAELPADGRPHVVRRWPTVRQPQTVAVDAASGRVFVTGRTAGVLEILRP